MYCGSEHRVFSYQVASSPSAEQIFQEWRIQDTEQLLKHLAKAKTKRMEAHEKLIETIGTKFVYTCTYMYDSVVMLA